MRTFVAKFPGECPLCGEDVRGWECTYTARDEVGHVLCPGERDFQGDPLPICPRCFLAIPSGRRTCPECTGDE